jgi:hypothetical protein
VGERAGLAPGLARLAVGVAVGSSGRSSSGLSPQAATSTAAAIAAAAIPRRDVPFKLIE